MGSCQTRKWQPNPKFLSEKSHGPCGLQFVGWQRVGHDLLTGFLFFIASYIPIIFFLIFQGHIAIITLDEKY